jgi:hypothetical protein
METTTTTAIQPLNEQDLALDVRELTLGTLTTNALQLRDHVAATLERYTPENYSEENVDQAKADRALLNKAAKELNDKRIQLERDWSAPFQEFKAVIGDTVRMITEGSTKIDAVVKVVESKAKAEKRAAIEELWERKNITLIPLSAVWDDRWLNKSKRLPAIDKEMGQRLLKIEADLEALNVVPEQDREVIRAYYLNNLDITRALAYSTELQDARKRLQDKEARKRAESEAQDTRQEYVAPTASQAPTTEAPEVVVPEILERTMVVRGTREQLVALAEYLKASGIWFRKA